jgi:hypothetical protein
LALIESRNSADFSHLFSDILENLKMQTVDPDKPGSFRPFAGRLAAVTRDTPNPVHDWDNKSNMAHNLADWCHRMII